MENYLRLFTSQYARYRLTTLPTVDATKLHTTDDHATLLVPSGREVVS
jgi:hypothetical protein